MSAELLFAQIYEAALLDVPVWSNSPLSINTYSSN